MLQPTVFGKLRLTVRGYFETFRIKIRLFKIIFKQRNSQGLQLFWTNSNTNKKYFRAENYTIS